LQGAQPLPPPALPLEEDHVLDEGTDQLGHADGGAGMGVPVGVRRAERGGEEKRAIQRGTGELPGVSYEEITYEGYGPGGAALIIETLTDNKNRTVGEMRHLLGKYGGNLAAENSVAWMFDKKGYIVVDKSKADEDSLMAAALDAGADDLRDDGDSWEIISAPDAFQKVLEAVKAMNIEPGAAELAFLPQNYVKLEGKPAQQMVKLMEAIEEHDDTKKVWSNADIEEKEIEASLA
jgi:YebC/PmpR family DNA-binding regulatory protein